MSGLDDENKPVSKIDPRLLEILVCPLTKAQLQYDSTAQELISRAAGLAYPIVDGVPIMLPDEARDLNAVATPSPAESLGA